MSELAEWPAVKSMSVVSSELHFIYTFGHSTCTVPHFDTFLTPPLCFTVVLNRNQQFIRNKKVVNS